MFERYTRPAGRVVHIAEGLAQAEKHPQAGTGHLLLGLMYERDSGAWQALTALGLTTDTVRDAVFAVLRSAPAAAWVHNQPLSPRLHTVLQDATSEALKLGCTYVGTEHLLLAAVRERDLAWEAGGNRGTALVALDRLGVDPTAVRGAMLRILQGRGTEHPVITGGEDHDGVIVPVSGRNPDDVQTEVLVRLERLERVLDEHVGEAREIQRKLGLVELPSGM
jgi:hypothetical protein